jgi:hypothetical protein
MNMATLFHERKYFPVDAFDCKKENQVCGKKEQKF